MFHLYDGCVGNINISVKPFVTASFFFKVLLNKVGLGCNFLTESQHFVVCEIISLKSLDLAIIRKKQTSNPDS